MNKLITKIFFIGLFQFCIVMSANSSVIALEFTTEPTDDWHWSGATIGWQFSTSTDLNIESLGIWDKGGDGLSDSHQIGLWKLDGTLLVSTVVSNGTGNTLESSFRWSDITSYFLSSGSYIVGAYMPTTDDRGAAKSSYNTANEITFNQNLFLYSNGFTKPTEHWSGHDGGNFGANFKYSIATVPEPSTLAIFVLGVIGLAYRRFNIQH